MKLALNIFFWAFMALCAIGLVCLRAEEPKPAPTIALLTIEVQSLKAENDMLKARIDRLMAEATESSAIFQAFQVNICGSPIVVAAKQATFTARQKEEAAVKAQATTPAVTVK